MTIRSVSGVQVETTPVCSKGFQFASEFKDFVSGISTAMDSGKKEISELLEKKSLTKADKEKIMNLLNNIDSKILNDLPFVEECFQEVMEKTVQSAKLDIEALAAEKLSTNIVKLIED